MGEIANYQCLSPVVVIVFNRPKKTEQLLQIVSEVKPSKLYVIADGPRPEKLNEDAKCQEVRRIVDEQVDWQCHLEKIYSEVNLGGPVRVPTGLKEVFEKEEKAIILEDDCIPNLFFFRFCDELLDYYKNNLKVGTICGSNLEYDFFGKPSNGLNTDRYFFSRYPASWGWATWKRVWDKFDYDFKSFPEFQRKGLINRAGKLRTVRKYWSMIFKDIYLNKRSNWDYKLVFSLMNNEMYSAIPASNLVSNIGFDEGSTHFDKWHYYLQRPLSVLSFPLIHPSTIEINERYDRRVGLHFFTSNKILKGLRLVRNFLRK